MEDFVHRENLIIFKRRLADAKKYVQRQLLVKLLAEEEAKGGLLTADAASRQARYETSTAEVTSMPGEAGSGAPAPGDPSQRPIFTNG